MQTVYNCKYGTHQRIPIDRTLKYYFDESFNIPPPYEFCNVFVSHLPILNTAYEFIKKKNRCAVVQFVSQDFTGETIEKCHGLSDLSIVMQTTFCKNINNSYPMTDTEVNYNDNTFVVRNDDMHWLNKSSMFRVGLITACFKKYKTHKNCIKYREDYIELGNQIETIFQTAIRHNNDTLILNDCGTKSNMYPINDMIDIINRCVYKYGHLFKNIVLSVNIATYTDKGYHSTFCENLIYPQKYFDEIVEKEKATYAQLRQEMQNIN
jgi:hypothetical protein